MEQFVAYASLNSNKQHAYPKNYSLTPFPYSPYLNALADEMKNVNG